jgi:hypothetical protein
MILAANVAYAKQIFQQRLGQDYGYGGSWSPTNLGALTDCSGLVGEILEALTNGPDMTWGHPVSTESWPYNYGNDTPAAPGTVGPYGTIAVRSLKDVPADAAAIVAIHHGGGGVDSHTNISVAGTVMEDNGDNGVCTTGTGAIPQTDSYWTDYWYLPGPITDDGTPIPTAPVDTLFADVSEFQAPVDDSYPYPVLSIRVCDGTYQDRNFTANYAWMRAALDSGKLTFGIVYTYVRPGSPSANASTVKQMIDAAGGLHPRVALMLDVESGGNPGGDQSGPINALFNELADYAGDPNRIIGYGNVSDLDGMWPTKPPGVRLIVAGYGANPDYPGKVAHQYTDGTGFGGGLPEGCPPFGNCDMNSADGLSPQDFAAACGIGNPPPAPPPEPQPEGWNDTMSPSPQDVLNNEQGVAQDGTPQWWNVVYGRHLATFGSLIANAQKGPWNEPYPNGVTQLVDSDGQVLPKGGVWDHGAHDVLSAEQLAWRYADSAGNTVDLQSMMMALWEYFLAKDPAAMKAAIAAAKVDHS